MVATKFLSTTNNISLAYIVPQLDGGSHYQISSITTLNLPKL
jgi:hypothetical protein